MVEGPAMTVIRKANEPYGKSKVSGISGSYGLLWSEFHSPVSERPREQNEINCNVVEVLGAFVRTVSQKARYCGPEMVKVEVNACVTLTIGRTSL